MTGKNTDHLGFKLEKISESSSPDVNDKGMTSSLRTCRGRVGLGGFN